MNKILILVILLISINFASEIEIDPKIMGGIYEKFLYIVKGMEAKGKSGCFNYLKANNDTGLMVVQAFIDLLLNGRIGGNYTSSNKLNSISDSEQGSYEDCHFQDFIPLILNSTSNNATIRTEFYKQIGKNIYNNSVKFREGTTKFVRKRTLNDRFELIGIISSAILNIAFD